MASRKGVMGAAFLSGGSLIGNVVAFMGSIVLARVYSPSEHGLLAVVSAYAVILTPLVSGRLEAALPILERDRDSFRLLNLGIIWATAVAGLLTVTVLSLSWVGHRPGSRLAIPEFLWAAPIFAVLSAYLALMSQFSVRQARYKALALRNVAYPATSSGAQLVFGVVGLGASGLVLGTIGGRILTLSLFLREFLRDRRRFVSDADSPSWRALIKRFSRFPSIFVVSAMINALGIQLPVVLLGYFYGTQAAGLFGMSQRTLSVPLGLIGAAIGQVFLSELGRAMRENTGSALSIFRRTSGLLLVAGIVVSGILLIWGPGLFSLVFGEEWRASGQIARAMGISFAVQLVASPLSQALVVYERHWVQLILDVGRLLLVAAALLAAHEFQLGLVASCWVLCVATTTSYIAYWCFAHITVARGRMLA